MFDHSRGLLGMLALGVMLPALLPAHAENGALGDPTRPTALHEAAPVVAHSGPRWQVQSTLVSPDRRVAVINGKSVRQGDRVDGATVVDIRADGVTLEVERHRIEFRLSPEAAHIRKSGK